VESASFSETKSARGIEDASLNLRAPAAEEWEEMQPSKTSFQEVFLEWSEVKSSVFDDSLPSMNNLAESVLGGPILSVLARFFAETQQMTRSMPKARHRPNEGRRKRRSCRNQADSTQSSDNRRGARKSGQRRPLSDFERRFGFKESDSPENWIKRFTSVSLLMCTSGEKNVEDFWEREENPHREFAARTISQKRWRFVSKMLSATAWHGDELLTRRADILCSAFSEYWVGVDQTQGCCCDETIVPMTLRFPHRMMIRDKPKSRGAWLYTSAYLSGVVFGIVPRRRDSWKTPTPAHATPLLQDQCGTDPVNTSLYEYVPVMKRTRNASGESTRPSYPNLNVLQALTRFLRCSDGYKPVIIVDRFYTSWKVFRGLLDKGVSSFGHMSASKLEQVLSQMSRGDSQITIGRKRVSVHKSKQSGNPMLMAGVANGISPKISTRLYNSTKHFIDDANRVVNGVIPKFQIGWATRIFMHVLLFSSYNAWIVFKNRIKLLSSRKGVSEHFVRTALNHVTFRRFITWIAYAMVGQQHSSYGEFKNKLKIKRFIVKELHEPVVRLISHTSPTTNRVSRRKCRVCVKYSSYECKECGKACHEGCLNSHSCSDNRTLAEIERQFRTKKRRTSTRTRVDTDQNNEESSQTPFRSANRKKKQHKKPRTKASTRR